MNPARMIFEDAPAFIPVPPDLQHRRVEAILWPLENEASTVASDSQNESLPPLTQLIGQAKGCFNNAAEIDAFIRAERDTWAR